MTNEQIEYMLAKMPDEPYGLLDFLNPEPFHGIVEWKVETGHMESKLLFSSPECEIFHTKLSPDTEVSWHDHNRSQEIIVCLDGALALFFENPDNNRVLKKKGVIAIEQKEKHAAVTGDKPTQIIAITIPREARKK